MLRVKLEKGFGAAQNISYERAVTQLRTYPKSSGELCFAEAVGSHLLRKPESKVGKLCTIVEPPLSKRLILRLMMFDLTIIADVDEIRVVVGGNSISRRAHGEYQLRKSSVSLQHSKSVVSGSKLTIGDARDIPIS